MEVLIRNSNWIIIKNNDIHSFGDGLIDLFDTLIAINTASNIASLLINHNGNVQMIIGSQVLKYLSALKYLFIENN